MMYAQTVEVPADRRIVIDVPEEIPAGAQARVWVEPATSEIPLKKTSLERLQEMLEQREPTIEELKQQADAQYAARKDTGIDPLEKFRGSKIFGDGTDGLTYQRKMRDEWPD